MWFWMEFLELVCNNIMLVCVNLVRHFQLYSDIIEFYSLILYYINKYHIWDIIIFLTVCFKTQCVSYGIDL